MANILAVIPARSGSKSVPHKNIREIGGKPMIAHSIEHGLRSKYINRVIVSTDSQEYADIAVKYGAEVPFLRPAEYATDTSLDYDVFLHALTWLRDKEGYEADVVVQLRPTYPIRNIRDIDTMIEMLLQDDLLDSVRSVSKATEVPYKMWLVSADMNDRKEDVIGGSTTLGKIQPLIKDIPECYNMPRQQLPTVYYQNACIDVFRPRVVLEQHSMSGTNIAGYLMEDNYDIDTEADFQKAMLAMEKRYK